jgi:hypothetical protein
MARFDFPRARGGRGPQIGPGTFNARVGVGGVKPPRFSAIAWCPGPNAPSIELWCLHQTYSRIGPDVGQSQDLFIDKIVDAEAFVPPPGCLPTSIACVNALKLYAANRRFDVDHVNSDPSEWTVHVDVPTPLVTSATDRKVKQGVYSVAQVDRPTGTVPLAWVWVSGLGKREIWLYFRTDQADGFHFVGTQPTGDSDVYTSTVLRYSQIVPLEWPWDAVASYGDSIASFKDTAMNDLNSPVSDPNDLYVHDLRVQQY